MIRIIRINIIAVVLAAAAAAAASAAAVHVGENRLEPSLRILLLLLLQCRVIVTVVAVVVGALMGSSSSSRRCHENGILKRCRIPAMSTRHGGRPEHETLL